MGGIFVGGIGGGGWRAGGHRQINICLSAGGGEWVVVLLVILVAVPGGRGRGFEGFYPPRRANNAGNPTE